MKSKHDAPADWLKAEKRPDDHYFSDPDANGGQPSGLTKDNAVWIGRASKEAGQARPATQENTARGRT